MKRPSKEVLRVVTQLEDVGTTDMESLLYAAEKIIQLRKALKQSLVFVEDHEHRYGGGTEESSSFKAEVQRLLKVVS